MLFYEIITFLHCKIWCQHMVLKFLPKLVNVHLIDDIFTCFFHGNNNYNILFYFCLTNFS